MALGDCRNNCVLGCGYFGGIVMIARIATALRTEASERAVCIAWGLAALPIAYIAWGACSVLFMGDYPI